MLSANQLLLGCSSHTGIKCVLHTSSEGLSFPLQSSAVVLSLSLKLWELNYLRDSCLFLELVAAGRGGEVRGAVLCQHEHSFTAHTECIASEKKAVYLNK